MIFTTKYANQKLIKSSFLNYIMYYISSPLVYLSCKFKLTPNILTTVSIFFSILAIYFLKINNILFFQASWFFSLLLDYSDGPLARKTKTFSKKFNYDHLSDLFKISLITSSFALFHQDFKGVSISFLFIFLLLFNEIIVPVGVRNLLPNQKSIITTYFTSRTSGGIVKLLQQLYNTIFIFHGHSLLLFLVAPKSPLITQLILSYFSILLLKSIIIKLIK
jgi:phosphatidylglycerophosphate synthase